MKDDLALEIAQLCDGHVCSDVMRALAVCLGTTLVQVFDTREEALDELENITAMLYEGIDSAFHMKETCGNA